MTKPDWNTITHIEKIDTLRRLVLEGWSCSQIASVFTNATKNAVLAFIYRYHLRKSDEVVARVRAKWVDRPYRKVDRIAPSRPKVNLATDPLTFRVVEAVNASGHPMNELDWVSGVSADTIRRWRIGRYKATPALAQAVLDTIEKLNHERA